MFDRNIMTFNPGWDQNAAALESFDDVRQIQKVLEEQGVVITTCADPEGSGPAHLILSDPDGNVIMLDQHV